MAESSQLRLKIDVAKQEWEQAVVALERARVAEQTTRWKLNDAITELENAIL